MTVGATLAGLAVLVTRPAHQNETLCNMIAERGGEPIAFPTLAIRTVTDIRALRATLGEWSDHDLAVFTSANAVMGARPLLPAEWPARTQVAAVGRATARALRAAGVPVHVCPDESTSEGLLATPELTAVQDRSVVLVKGAGGRPLLADTLAARGARVRILVVYRRERPVCDPAPLLTRWRAGRVHVAVATSGEALANLFDIVGPDGRQWLCNTPVLVVSPRGRQLALDLGVAAPVLIAPDAADAAVVATLEQWHLGHSG